MGYAHSLYAGKIGGNFQATAGYWFEGPSYDPNDLGFLQNNNTVNYGIQLQYNHFDLIWHINSLYTLWWSGLYPHSRSQRILQFLRLAKCNSRFSEFPVCRHVLGNGTGGHL